VQERSLIPTQAALRSYWPGSSLLASRPWFIGQT